MLGANTLLGVNGFYDTSRLFNKWYSSGGVGLELAANVAGDDAIDLNLNWYGNLFNRDVLINAFRNKGNSFDVEAGYSHALLNRSLDLRLKLAGYQFDIGTAVQGWRGGADLTTRDGMFTLRYEYGHDRIDGNYNTVAGFVTVGFQLENLLSGESPFAPPEPVFRSPRDLRRSLGLKIKRNWHQPEAVVLALSSANGPTPCPLPGVSIIQQSIPFASTFGVGTVPDPTPQSGVTLYWSGLQQPATIQVLLNDGDTSDLSGRVATANVNLIPPCGSVLLVPNNIGRGEPGNRIQLFGPGPYPLLFDPGGVIRGHAKNPPDPPTAVLSKPLHPSMGRPLLIKPEGFFYEIVDGLVR